MRKGTVMGGGLWLAVLAGAYHWGVLQSETLSRPLVIDQNEAAKRPHRIQPVRSRAEIIGDFQERLRKRDEILIHDELWLLADEWASQEPEAAVTWMNQLEFDDVRNPYLFAALSQWAVQDQESALAWVAGQQPEKEESELYLKAALIRGMARNDPDAAAAFLLKQPKSLMRSTIDFVLGAWAQESLQRAFAGISGLPAELRILAYGKIAKHLSPETLAQACEVSLSHESSKERAALQKALADRWAQRSPEEALAWAEKIPIPDVTATVAKQWARQEPLKASTWLATRRGTPEYDLSARAVAWSVVGLDAHLAFSQVEAIQSEGLRLETFEQMGRFWISDQPTQARAFLEGDNPLPPDLREALLSHFE